ncbi:FtsX-like permease family protein [Amphibacillus cookii]|uniref:FtsX-like permease family protein n=1 Tax=Amphibacillus cookii TaxID=767787 RepID=UPI00195A244B|nr:ABC transporter permease [Amphibacillus cookii]MBM7542807.1 putative ABC transport system permease protein [Amphibacillus cookii]
MTLFDIALKNIRRNLKSYGLYIASTIFSIIIYFTFVTLRYSDNIRELEGSSRQVSGIMSGSAFVLMIFVAIFIAYSNVFFMKKRKKEVALYSLLGVRKRSIGRMLFFENMVIGLFSLLVGIGLGFLISQLLLALLMNLMGLNMTLDFAFSLSAVMNTAIVFLIIFLVTSLQGYRVIYRFKLIDLFHAEKKAEMLPKARVVSTILGLLALGGGYWLALEDITTSQAWRILGLAIPLVIIGLTILGSYLIFRSVLVSFLHFFKKRKSLAWKGLNLMTVSQLLYRIRANARTLTIIATLSATTITAGGAVFGIYYNADRDVQAYTPFTFMWKGEAQEIDSSDVTFEASIQTKETRVTQDDIEMAYTLLDYTTFTTLAEQLGWETIEEPAEDELLLVNAIYDERWSPRVDDVALNGNSFSVSEHVTEAILNVSLVGPNVLVLADQQYDSIDAEEEVYQVVDMENYRDHLELSQALSAETENFTSATEDYHYAIETSGALLFVGSFLGLVFLVATGSVIYFKIMIEAEEDKGTYSILHNIGIPKKEMKRSIHYQVGLIFMAPLLLGLLHGAIALFAFSNMLQLNLWIPVLLWMMAYTCIYIIYYFVTVRSFKHTVLHKL